MPPRADPDAPLKIWFQALARSNTRRCGGCGMAADPVYSMGEYRGGKFHRVFQCCRGCYDPRAIVYLRGRANETGRRVVPTGKGGTVVPVWMSGVAPVLPVGAFPVNSTVSLAVMGRSLTGTVVGHTSPTGLRVVCHQTGATVAVNVNDVHAVDLTVRPARRRRERAAETAPAVAAAPPVHGFGVGDRVRVAGLVTALRPDQMGIVVACRGRQIIDVDFADGTRLAVHHSRLEYDVRPSTPFAVGDAVMVDAPTLMPVSRHNGRRAVVDSVTPEGAVWVNVADHGLVLTSPGTLVPAPPLTPAPEPLPTFPPGCLVRNAHLSGGDVLAIVDPCPTGAPGLYRAVDVRGIWHRVNARDVVRVDPALPDSPRQDAAVLRFAPGDLVRSRSNDAGGRVERITSRPEGGGRVWELDVALSQGAGRLVRDQTEFYLVDPLEAVGRPPAVGDTAVVRVGRLHGSRCEVLAVRPAGEVVVRLEAGSKDLTYVARALAVDPGPPPAAAAPPPVDTMFLAMAAFRRRSGVRPRETQEEGP